MKLDYAYKINKSDILYSVGTPVPSTHRYGMLDIHDAKEAHVMLNNCLLCRDHKTKKQFHTTCIPNQPTLLLIPPPVVLYFVVYGYKCLLSKPER